MIKAVINLEAPREHVFSILIDYPRYKQWLPGCEQSDVVSSLRHGKRRLQVVERLAAAGQSRRIA